MGDEERVAEYLKTLSICHYVYAGLAACGSCLGLFYVGMGGFLAAVLKQAAKSEQAPPPEMLGWLFGGIGAAIIVVALTVATLCFLSARAMSRRTNRTLSLVVAGIVCATGFLGIALGVFTFIVLLKPETERLYAGTPPA